MSSFSYAIQTCGLNEHEAAEYLGASDEQIRLWCERGSSAPPEAWTMLADLDMRIEESASVAATMLFDLGLKQDDLDTFFMERSEEPLPGKAAHIAGARALLRHFGRAGR